MPSLHPLLSQCDPAGRRPVKTGDQQIIIVARSAPQIPHCTGGGIRSDGGSSARSGRENDGQQASAEAACGLCRAATVEAVQSFASQQRSLLCPLSEHLRPIPTEVPCGHFWRHLLVTKGGKSAPCRRRPIEGAGCFPKNRSENLSSLKILFPCFWLDPKAPKDQARRKVADDDTRAR